MTTRRKSEFEKARGDVRRSISRMVRMLPYLAFVNWRNIVMPWRMLPVPVALALIALVALAMILDNGSDANAQPLAQDVTIGSDTVAPGTHCEEDEVISYRALLGGQGVGCVHYEYVIMDYLTECLIGNSEYGDNLASLHLRDQAFGSWCADVVDDASDGMVSLSDLLIDTASVGTVAPAITPTIPASLSDAQPVTPMLPIALPATGSR